MGCRRFAGRGAGQRRAVRELLPALRAICVGVLRACDGSRGSGCDLAAETFACALESVRTYDPLRGRADQWLFGIARNVLGKSYRHGRVDAAARERLGLPTLILDDDMTSQISRLSDDEDMATVALAELPPEQRRAILARVVEERDYADIAGELECSEAVVRQRVSRGLRLLRTRLAGNR
ncbi:MAG TPA: RNA polymerase sigma factor [Solirubrobacteraceae bacterium]